MGVDPGFGSSAFGIVVTRFVDGRAQILFADEFERPDYDEMLQKVLELRRRYDVDKIYTDGANPELVRSIKIHIGKRSDLLQYLELIQRAKKCKAPIENYMNVIPVHFSREHWTVLAHSKMILERGGLMIHPKFDKLITAIRSAVENGEGILDKEVTSYDDIFDPLRLAMR